MATRGGAAAPGRADGRSAAPRRILLTGGTGFLGSHLAVALLREGHRVTLLARPRNGTSAESRISRLLDWLGADADCRSRVEVVRGDILKPAMGLTPAGSAQLAAGTDEVVHCASDTSFAERRRAEVEATNIGGTANVLDLAASAGASSFHLISTAYAAGRRRGRCPEAPLAPEGFHNAYEESKWRAEAMVRERCRAEGMALSVHRPSVVCGDSRTGRTLLFNAVYYPVRTALFLRDVLAKDLRERGGRRAAAMGGGLDADGAVRLPIRIGVGEGEGVNIVPVDHFTAAFLALRAAAPEGGTFHIVNPRLKPVGELVEHASRMFGLRGIEAVPASVLGAARSPLEVLFDGYLEAYAPYMRDTRTFGTEVSGPILEARGIVCPEFDYGLFSRCMAYAVESRWGAAFPDA